MRPMEEAMTILYSQNDPKRINSLEEMEIMKATTADHMFNITRTSTRSTKCYNPFKVRQRPAHIIADDASVMMKGLTV